MVDDELTRMLKRQEGLRLQPYRDTQGVLTIGYGLNLEEGITTSEAEYLLQSRINQTRRDLHGILPEAFRSTTPRANALIGMLYNLGMARFLKFKRAIWCVQQGDWAGAADEVIDSKWAKQLPARAKETAEILRWG